MTEFLIRPGYHYICFQPSRFCLLADWYVLIFFVVIRRLVWITGRADLSRVVLGTIVLGLVVLIARVCSYSSIVNVVGSIVLAWFTSVTVAS